MRFDIPMSFSKRTIAIWGVLVWTGGVEAFTPSARWGSASTIYTSSSSTTPYLLVLGGKADPTSAYTYSSSPDLTSSTFTSSDDDSSLLALDISSNFSTSAPAWIALDDSTAPASVWGVMSPTMVYGGDGGTSLAIQTGNDSLYTFTSPTSITSTSDLTFAQASSGTQGQPIRTIYSAISTSADGTVSYVTGGEKDDGSGTGYAAAYKVTTTSSSTTFTQLPNLPTDLCHHKMVLLANGTLVTIGGYVPSTSTFVSMTTVYTLDTTSSTASWQTVSLDSSSSTPAGRRGHAAVLLNVPSTTAETESLQTVARRGRRGGLLNRAETETYSETIVVHGGTSGSLLGGTPLSDLWSLDLSVSSPTWTSISSSTSSSPSARMDAIAQAVGYQLLVFGGYGSSGAADDSLYVYNALTQEWTDTFDTAGTEWTAEEIAAESGSIATGTGTGGSSSGAIQTVSSTSATGTGSTHTMGPTQTGFPTGSATAAAVTTGSGKTTRASTGSSSSGTSSATSTAVATNRLSSNTTAIAVGTSLGVLATLGGLVAILFVVRRRRRGTNGRFQPYGSKKPGYQRKGDGAEALMTEKDYAWQTEDYLALGGEKRMVSVNAASDYSGIMGTMDRRPVAMARYSGDREGNVIRRDMLEDEDRSYRRNPSGGGPEGEDDDSVSILRYGEDYTDDEDLAGPSRLYQDVGTPRAGVAVPTRPPSERSQTVDPFEDSYGAPVLDYAYGGDNQYLNLPGVSRHRSNSPISSVGSATGSNLGRIETARKVSLAQGNAAVVPVTRGQSMLKRLNIPSFFGAGGASSSDRRGFATLGDERGFMDPSTPPAMAPLGMHDSMFDSAEYQGATGPSAWSAAAKASSNNGQDAQDRRKAQLASDMTRHGRSVSSVVTAATIDTEVLERYQRMNVIQRERTRSSAREEDEGEDGLEGASQVSRGQVGQKPLPTRPASPTRPRTVNTPRGPRPASPTRQSQAQPSSPIRPYITAPAPATPSRRHVKDMAASINRRDTRDDYSTDLYIPSPMMASAAAMADGSGVGGMMSPSRGSGFGNGAGAGGMASPGAVGRAMGPRGPKKVYEYQERGELRIANR